MNEWIVAAFIGWALVASILGGLVGYSLRQEIIVRDCYGLSEAIGGQRMWLHLKCPDGQIAGRVVVK